MPGKTQTTNPRQIYWPASAPIAKHRYASSILFVWDIYPIEQFSNFWLWVESSLNAETLVTGQPNYDEVGHVSPDCHAWLYAYLTVLPVDIDVVSSAIQINHAIGVSGGSYHPSGVDENDVF